MQHESQQSQSVQQKQINYNSGTKPTVQRKVIQLTLEDMQNDNEKQNKQNILTRKAELKRCPLRQGCEDIHNYQRLNKIHQGIYGVVYRALEIPSNTICAVKKLKIQQNSDFPITSLRQISILRNIDHPNIMKIFRVAGSSDKTKVYIVMQYLDHELKQLLKVVQFSQNDIKRLVEDLLKGIAYLHDRKIIHRDLKTSNLLYSNQGILKICDFGLARKASEALMTQQVITMWYRPPELLLGQYNYSIEVDIWSIGCIMAELIIREPFFKGKTQLQQLDLIFKAVGSPTQQNWPDIKQRQFKNYMYFAGTYHFYVGKKYTTNKLRQMIPLDKISNQGIQLLKGLLTVNPKQRITAKKALNHAWFKKDMTERQKMPKHQPINQSDRVKKKVHKNQNQ